MPRQDAQTASRDLTAARQKYARADFVGTRMTCERILAQNKSVLEARFLLGCALRELGDYPAAARHLQTCVQRLPREAQVHLELARTLFLDGRTDEALQRLDKVQRRFPGHVGLAVQRAQILDNRGEYAEARVALDTLPLEPDVILTRCSIDLHDKDYAAAEAGGRQLLEAAGTADSIRAQAGYLVGQARDAVGDHAGAMDAWITANTAVPAPFDEAAWTARIDAIIAFFDASRMAALPRATHGSTAPVFVVGMPRTGTTLVEQIIQAHPEGFGAGELRTIDTLIRTLPEQMATMRPYPDCLLELTTAKADALARPYLDQLRTIAPDASRIVNKSLDNNRAIGVIAALYPQARIVAIDRDAHDAGLSMYSHPFSLRNAPYTTRLRDIGVAFREHRRLMNHWRTVTDLPWLDITYESLTANADAEIRRLIEFLDLPWDDRCLRFHESKRDVMTLSAQQVTQPIYRRAVGRAAAYGDVLDDIDAGLVGSDVKLGKQGD